MSLLTDLRSFLLADSTISSLIGSRFYPGELPQDATLPAIVYSTISGYRPQSQEGPSGIVRLRIQIDCWAETYAGAEALAEAVRLRLNGYRGSAGSGEIKGAFFDSERDLSDSETDRKARSVDYMIWSPETT